MKTLLNRLYQIVVNIPVPFMLLFICTLAYGLLIPWLGFYVDDWYIVYFQKLFEGGNFNLFFEGDRPFFAYVYQVFMPIFKDSILGWQLFALFARSLLSICYWLLLSILMPGKKKLAAIAALLFTVYPGFQFHWFSVQYAQFYMLFAVYLSSFILMIEAVRKERGKFLLFFLSVVCLIIGIAPKEDFVGLELMRPIILLVLFSNLNKNKLQWFKKVFLIWLPYLLVMLGFVIYRITYSELFRYPVKILAEIQVSPLTTFLGLAGEVFWSTIDATLTAWINPFLLLKRDMLSVSSILMAVVIMVGFLSSYHFLKDKKGNGKITGSNKWIMIMGFMATVSAMIPFIAGSFDVTLDFPNNRYLLALAPGASIFLAGLIDWLFRSDKQKIIAWALLIGFAAGSQFMVARSFMLYWQQQQDFFWQLSWRAPSIKDNTLLITYDLPFSRYYSGPSLTAPMNMIYAGENDTHEIPYRIILYSQERGAIQDFSADQPITNSFRSFDFHGNTSSMLVLRKNEVGCLQVLAPSDALDISEKSPGYSFWQTVIPLSNPDQIIVDPADPAVPPQQYFGVENRDQWCYFYEKAELSRQQGQWQQTIKFYEDAYASGFKPVVDAEWLPLVEAYLRVGSVDKALEITNRVNLNDTKNRSAFCSLWKKFVGNEIDQQIVNDELMFLNCSDH